MKQPFLTFDYFASNLLDPIFEVFEVLGNNSHSEYNNLLNDIGGFSQEELNKYFQENHIDELNWSVENKEQFRRAYYLVHLLQKNIAKERLKKLTLQNRKPPPYNSKNLIDIELDEHFLASVDQFNLESFGYRKNGFVYTLCPTIEQSNSSYWISQAIMKFTKEKGLNFKIRLDPFIEIAVNKYSPILYKMLVHGRPLDWNRLKNLKNEEFGKWINEKSYNNVGSTDFVWKPMKHEVHFTCEELPKLEYCEFRGGRYFHAIFDKSTGKIKHCDGAIRIYNEDELAKRSKFHVRNSEVRKVGKRVKIFQINNDIDQDIFCQLATNFFVWNEDVLRYFS